MANELPVMASLFGEDNAEACFGLVADFFAKPPMFGPRAVFLVYEPGTVESPLALCKSLEAEVRPLLPEGSICAFRAVMKGDSGFDAVSKDVLWFDLTTGEAFPPEQRKLGFKNKKAAAPATDSKPHPGIGLDDNEQVPLLVIPDPSSKKRRRKPIAIGPILSTVMFGAIAIAAGIYLYTLLSGNKKDDKPKAPAKQTESKRRRQQSAGASRGTEAATNAIPSNAKPELEEPENPEPPEEPETPAVPDAAEVLRREQDPFEEGKGPRYLDDLVEKLDIGSFAWGELRPEGFAPANLPEGSVWWLVCARAPSEKSSPTDIYRIATGPGGSYSNITAFANGKPSSTPVDPKEIDEIRRERQHAEIFCNNCWVFGAGPEVFEKKYPYSGGMLFEPHKLDLGEAFASILKSAGRGRNPKTDGLTWTVAFTYCDGTIEHGASIDRGWSGGDISREVKARRDEIVKSLRRERDSADSARAAQEQAAANSGGGRNADSGRRASAIGSGARSGFAGGRGSSFDNGRAGSRLGSGVSGGFAGARSGGDSGRMVGGGRNTGLGGSGGGSALEGPAAPRTGRTPLEIAEQNARRDAIDRDLEKGWIIFRRNVK